MWEMIIGRSTLQNIILINDDTVFSLDFWPTLILPMWIEGEMLMLMDFCLILIWYHWCLRKWGHQIYIQSKTADIFWSFSICGNIIRLGIYILPMFLKMMESVSLDFENNFYSFQLQMGYSTAGGSASESPPRTQF